MDMSSSECGGGGSTRRKLRRPIVHPHSSTTTAFTDTSTVAGDESSLKVKVERRTGYHCPICMELIHEAHITRCGHSFCFVCITQAIDIDPKCPICSTAVSRDDLVPNLSLTELVARVKNWTANSELSETLGSGESLPTDGLREFVRIGSEGLTLPDLNTMLEVLASRKNALEAEMSTAQNELLHDFLIMLQQQCESRLDRLNREMTLIKKDLTEVQAMLNGSSLTVVEGDVSSRARNFRSFNEASIASRRRRIHAHFDDFVQCYFATRAQELAFTPEEEASVPDGSTTPDTSYGLHVFRENLVKFSRYNSVRTLATLSYSTDIFNSATIVSSIEFDKDYEFFAIGGVMKLIKVYDYGDVTRDAVDIHYPSVEMTSNSKISDLSWNAYHKGTLASSDYEGSVTVWDVTTGQKMKVFMEHEKRCWSVDFNNIDTRLIASGSDDSRVKLWDMNNDHSVASLEAKANVCCVKFNPCSSFNLAFGSADHCVHYYDLRRMKEPLTVFKGHRKAVSYVKFLNRDEFVSASTDSQLKLWNVQQSHCTRSFVGHINEKNFVGLATDGDYVASGSENNSLYLYYKGFTKKLFSFKFEPQRGLLEKTKKDEDMNDFVSSVCWKLNSNVLIAANSQGIIKILELV